LSRKKVIHQYTKEGTYSIALEVKNSDGLTNKTVKNLTVSEFIPDDYFPLNIGNIWDYSFSSNSRDDIEQNSSNSHGTASLELFAIENGETEITYYLKFKKQGQRISSDFNISTGETTYDTTYISINDTLVFKEDSTGIIKSVGLTSFFGFELPRYTIDEPDTLVFYSSYTTYKMAKNIGIVYYISDYYHNWFGSTTQWTLTGYDFK
jgi:hypothetical protein